MVDRGYSNHDHRNKQSRTEGELEPWHRYHHPNAVGSRHQFWIEQSQEPLSNFPNLARLALDIYSISARRAKYEWVFSETKRVITDNRNQLSETTIEAIQCQKNLLDNDVVHSELTVAVKQQQGHNA